MWRTEMINTKKQIKFCFNLSNRVSLNDVDCKKRVRYIYYKLHQAGFDATDWQWQDLYDNYILPHTTPYSHGFDESDYVAMCLVWYEGATYNKIDASAYFIPI